MPAVGDKSLTVGRSLSAGNANVGLVNLAVQTCQRSCENKYAYSGNCK